MTKLAEIRAKVASDEHGVWNLSQADIEYLLSIAEAAQAELKAAYQDAAFYRSCALSGEIPIEGSEPSAQALKGNDDG